VKSEPPHEVELASFRQKRRRIRITEFAVGKAGLLSMPKALS
jgi:hypothetical protein